MLPLLCQEANDMAKAKEKSINLADRLAAVQRQFKNLDTKDPSVWPIAPKVILVFSLLALLL